MRRPEVNLLMCPFHTIGSYCPDSGMSQPLPCPPGRSSTLGQTSCPSCNDTSLCEGAVAPRWSQPIHRSSQTITCRPGTYRDSREELACVVCPVGSYLSLHSAIYIAFPSVRCPVFTCECFCSPQVITV